MSEDKLDQAQFDALQMLCEQKERARPDLTQAQLGQLWDHLNLVWRALREGAVREVKQGHAHTALKKEITELEEALHTADAQRRELLRDQAELESKIAHQLQVMARLEAEFRHVFRRKEELIKEVGELRELAGRFGLVPLLERQKAGILDRMMSLVAMRLVQDGGLPRELIGLDPPPLSLVVPPPPRYRDDQEEREEQIKHLRVRHGPGPVKQLLPFLLTIQKPVAPTTQGPFSHRHLQQVPWGNYPTCPVPTELTCPRCERAHRWTTVDVVGDPRPRPRPLPDADRARGDLVAYLLVCSCGDELLVEYIPCPPGVA